jgi:hypothetical protein
MKAGCGECGAIDEGSGGVGLLMRRQMKVLSTETKWRGTAGAEADEGGIGEDQAAQDSQRGGRWRRHQRRPDGRAVAPSTHLMSSATTSHLFYCL